ncbi:MAG: FHA domain-containing protein [Akkermansiaceae bacterium]|nr:FHA domain-containing protein [Akkermansiaceae bacterium]
MASLIITINERKQGFDLPAILGKVTVIGCDDACDITLSGVDGLSHRQCSITCTKEGFLLEDLESTNGTYANEQEVEEPQLMKEGVIYAIGDASMIIAELANFAPIEPKETPVPAAAAVVSEAKTAPIAEAATAPIPDATDTKTAPLAEDNKTAPLADTAEATENATKPPAHTRPLPGRKPARKARLNTGKQKKRALSDEELKQKAKMLANAMGGSGVSTLYVVVILIAALYAGMALYSWQSEGNPVPAFFR